MDMKKWISKYHGMELSPHADNNRRGNENGILFLAYYLCLKEINFTLKDEDVGLFVEICRNLKSRGADGKLIDGLYDRGQGESSWTDKTSIRTISHDNLTAIACFSKIHDLDYNEHIAQYGAKNLWRFDNVYPENPRWERVQHPRDIIFWSYLAGSWIAKPFMFIPMISCIVSCHSYKDENGMIETSGKLLTFLRLYSIKDTWTGKITWKICNWLINRNFQHGWQDIFGIYFTNVENPILDEADEAYRNKKELF